MPSDPFSKKLTIDFDYLSAKKFAPPFQVVNVQNTQAMIEGCDAVCLFIPKNDVNVASRLTETFLSAVQAANVPRIVWIAPIGSDEQESGRLLAQAESMVRAYHKPTVIVRHGILFSQLLHHREEIRGRHTLSLPLPDQALLWVAAEDVAELALKGMGGQIKSSKPIIVGMKQTGEELARVMSDQLAANLKGDRFAQRRFEAIDENKDGILQPEELRPYMAELGYSPGEVAAILEEADLNKDGVIQFEEFVHGMAEHLDRMLADVPTEVRYLKVPDSAFLYDMGLRGMGEEVAQQYLSLFKQTVPKRTTAVKPWLARPLTSYPDWVDEHVLNFLSVYILPGKGVLSIQEGHFANHSARIIRLVYPSGRTLLGRRTLTNRATEFRWNDFSPDEVETIRHAGEGSVRTIEIKDKRLVGLHVRGNWPGLRWAIPLLFTEKELPDWQLSLFRESGQLQTQQEELLGSPDDVICNCTGMVRRSLTDLIDSGTDSLSAIGEQTQVTNICGGCRPLVQEMLGDSSWTSVDVSQKISVGEQTCTFRFTPNNKPLKPANPGQHIVVQGEVDGQLVQRPYTISSAANETHYREITVKREANGLFTNWLFDEKWRDAPIRLSDPQGGYFADLSRPEAIVCLVAGIGMTPALSICRSVIQAKTGQTVYVDFCTSDWNQMLYADELRKLAATHDEIHVNLRVTKEHGRLGSKDIGQLIELYPEARYYICGPTAYQNAVESHLQAAGVADERINIEEFTPLNTQPRLVLTKEGTQAAAITAPSQGYFYLGLFLVLAFAVQDILQLKWAWIEALQMGETYRRWSGLLLTLYLAAQFILPVMRLRGNLPAVARHHHLHKLQGALAPLVYYIHATAMGYAYLLLLSIVYFANFLLGLFNNDIVSKAEDKARYLHYWLAPHIGLSILTVALVIYHIYIVFAYQ